MCRYTAIFNSTTSLLDLTVRSRLDESVYKTFSISVVSADRRCGVWTGGRCIPLASLINHHVPLLISATSNCQVLDDAHACELFLRIHTSHLSKFLPHLCSQVSGQHLLKAHPHSYMSLLRPELLTMEPCKVQAALLAVKRCKCKLIIVGSSLLLSVTEV